MSDLVDGQPPMSVEVRESRQAPRARPVADAPLEALLSRAGLLSRSWAIALIEGLPPDRIAEVPLAKIGERGEELITQVLASLASDVELQHLALLDLEDFTPAGERGELIVTVEALRGVIWEAMLEELRQARVREVAELSDRLAHACAVLAASARVREVRGEEPEGPGAQSPALADELPCLIDEGGREQERRIEIRDTRGGEPHTRCAEAIERRLERFAVDSLPFAVLLCEVADGGPLPQTHAPEGESVFWGVQEALGRELGPMDVLSTEREGRYWLIVPEADASTARILAERLAHSVRSAAMDPRAPLEMAVGIAICPDHGRHAPALCAHAEVDIYAARAAGCVVAPADDPAAGL